MKIINKAMAAVAGAAIVAGLVFNSYIRIELGPVEAFAEEMLPSGAPALEYSFPGTTSLKEAATQKDSASSLWWLRSGAMMKNSNGVGKTLAGDLPSGDPYRLAYAAKSPVASDNGYHPQNIFRLLSQGAWQDSEAGVYFKVLDDNLFHKENSHGWNSLSVLSRYSDENNYYYAGVRMDGTAVIKKKRNGTYSTLASKAAFPGTYDSATNPNLLPKNTKIGIKFRTYNQANGTVAVKLYTDIGGTGSWKLAAEAVDSGRIGGAAITKGGKTGIYTDYMDVEFSNFKLYNLRADADGGTVNDPEPAPTPAPEPAPTEPAPTGTSSYGLSTNMTLSEAGSMSESSSPHWWVNSGAYFTVSNGIGKTVQGRLPDQDRWRLLYSSANPLDTENGFEPQNIFRLITKSSWEDYTQQGYFKINDYNTSASPNREGHNGILFFNRYKDGNNLYYTGVRVDGKAVIKKKVGGTYYTLASKTVYSGTFDRSSNPNLIPEGKWIGIRSEVKDNPDGSVSIKLFVDKDGTGSWTLAAEATDSGAQGAKITGKHSAGIRTDFMDVEVKGYSVKEF